MSHIGEEALARFCDRQTDGQKVQKQYVSPWKRGDIITNVENCFPYCGPI
jgi:hypothetical protein